MIVTVCKGAEDRLRAYKGVQYRATRQQAGTRHGHQDRQPTARTHIRTLGHSQRGRSEIHTVDMVMHRLLNLL